jgi:Holliday junction resolvase RusA-like endonuclease
VSESDFNVVTFGVEPAAFQFEIPGNPVPYQRMLPRAGGRGMVQPDNARAYQKHAALHAMLAARKQRWKRLPKKALVQLDIEIYRTVRSGDLSNYVKIVEDAINDSKAIWHDDRYVVATVARMWKSKRPRVVVEVRLVEDDEEEA